ncbi:aldehyde dehydrogenase [bacterium (candidate division B38) B3_B38]|nr:MAG: aldehyde dehydrogenase [bacterium (candidate division B38) B3_B38]
MADKRKFLVGGKWRISSEEMEVLNPYNGEVVGAVYRATADDIEVATTTAVKAWETTRKLPLFQRAEILGKVSSGIEKRKEELARTICFEAGKPISQARAEVSRAVNTFQIGAEEAKRIGGELIPLDLHPRGLNRVSITRRYPLGPVIAISPFNFPLNLIAHKMAPCIASGNSIVLKPSSATPLTALILAEIVLEAGFPPPALSVLPCRPALAEKMAVDGRFKLLTFTGSSDVGWRLKGMAGKKRTLLELGGNAGVIVHKDADLDYAAERCVTGGFSFAGQICISVQRVYVQEEVYPAFQEKFLTKVREIKTGDPRDEGTLSGPVIDDGAADRIMEWIEEARNHGATLLTGGERDGRMIQPTVLSDVDPSLRISCREVFGPVVLLAPYKDFTEAVAKVNDSVYGLQAGVFTKDVKSIFYAFDEIEVGGILINDIPTWRIDHMPYGGVKDSGMGREGLKYAIKEMTELRLLIVNLQSS